jgi:hypothetical protein
VRAAVLLLAVLLLVRAAVVLVAVASAVRVEGSQNAASLELATGGQGDSAHGESGSSSIATWVQAHFKSVTIGGETVYVLHS